MSTLTAELPTYAGFSALTLILSAVVVMGVLLAFLGLAGGAPQVDEITMRLERYSDTNVAVAQVPHGHTPREVFQRLSEAFNVMLSHSERTGRLADDLAKADIKLKSSEWVMGIAGVGVVLGLLLWVRFGLVVLLPVGLVVSYFASGVALRFMQARRSRAFDRQLGDTIILLSNALKAGYSFAQAISTVAKSATAPISEEFSRATREMALGITVDEALHHMVKRNQSEDFDLMVTAVQIHRVVGGNLAEILDTIATTIRERVRIKGEIRTLTAQARASGWIISILPIALAGILSVISPDYFNPMFHESLGLIMLMVAGISMAIGIALIQKLVKIEV